MSYGIIFRNCAICSIYGAIVLISKYILVKTLRNLAENLKLKSKTVGNIAGIATSVPELLTIVLPIFFILIKTEIQVAMVPIFILLYLGFTKIDNNAHKLYLKHEDKEIGEIQEKEERWERGNKRKIAKNIIILVLTGILLFVVGNLLGTTLENLCISFGVLQLVIGVILGLVTSIPELITFFESQKHHSKSKNDILGVVEATNNLLTSNMMNLFLIQSVGIIIFAIFHG